MTNENWILKTGDELQVRNVGEWATRTFLCMWRGKYLCALARHTEFDDPDTTSWEYAKPIPKPQYRPYTMEEFMAAYVKQGMPLDMFGELCGVLEDTLRVRALISGVCTEQRTETYESLLRLYEWPDGTPCGVEVVS